MPIRSRYIQGGDASARYLMPDPISDLFDKALPIGSIIPRRHFFKHDLTRADDRRRIIDMLWFWVRPAFTSYIHNPRTHIIVVGHILLCDPEDDAPAECSRSVRLFVDEAGYRASMYKTLTRRVLRDASKNLPYR